eukprot:jgi/Bigna1/75592/fgenesh1_pg.35_\
MGCKVSLTNDYSREFYFELRDDNGKPIPQFKCKLDPEAKIILDASSLVPFRLYTLEMTGKGEGIGSQNHIKFYAWQQPNMWKVGASRLRKTSTASILHFKEGQFLVRKILPGVRIADRESYGVLYRRCFAANELVTYLLLNHVVKSFSLTAKNLPIDTLTQSRKGRGIMPTSLRYASRQEFSISFLLLQLNEKHPFVGGIGHLQRSAQTMDESTLYRFALRLDTCSTQLSLLNKAMEGWLAKKGALSYSVKFYRILPLEERDYEEKHNHDSQKKRFELACFEDEVSLKPLHRIPMNDVEMIIGDLTKRLITVEYYSSNSNKKKKLVLKCSNNEIWFRWSIILKKFAKKLTPYDTLAKTGLRCALSEKALKHLAKHVSKKKIKKGTCLAKKGEVPKEFIIVSKGSLGIFVPNNSSSKGGDNDDDSKETKRAPISSSNRVLVSKRNACDVFGESMFMSHPNPYRSCEALEDSEPKCSRFPKVLALGARALEQFLGKFAEARRQLTGLFESKISESIEMVSIFKNLPLAHKQQLRLCFNYSNFIKGETIFEEKKHGSSMYIVVEGEVEATYFDSQDGVEMYVNRYDKGSVFGEMQVIQPGSRTNTMKAVSDSLLLEIQSKDFHAITNLLKIKHIKLMGNKIADALCYCELFSALPKEDLADITNEHGFLQCFEAEEVIFKQGEVGERFYLILTGELEVFIDDQVVNQLGPGEFFGEIALAVKHMTRTATVKCLTSTFLFVIEKSSFKKLFLKKSKANVSIIELRIAGDACDLRSIIYHPKGYLFFENFLETKDRGSMLRFWDDCRKFRLWAATKDLLDNGSQVVTKRAKEIYDKYEKEEMLGQLQLSDYKGIKEDITNGDADALTFCTVEKEIMSQMSDMYLESFKASTFFLRLMNTVAGSYRVDSDIKKMYVSRHSRNTRSHMSISGIIPPQLGSAAYANQHRARNLSSTSFGLRSMNSRTSLGTNSVVNKADSIVD